MALAAEALDVAGNTYVSARAGCGEWTAVRSFGLARHRVALATAFYCLLYTAFFAPVVFTGGLLAPRGDGLQFFLPVVCSGPRLWTSALFGGYPLAADPQGMSWYPPALLLAYPDQRWNILVLSAYVLASTFAYLLIRSLTGSDFAGLLGGVVYGMSGFFMGHLGHTNLVHSAAWLPLIMLGIHRLAGGFHAGWFIATAAGVGLCILGGHPQTAVYSVGFAGVYAVCTGGRAAQGRRCFYTACVGALGMGCGLAAMQILPTLELARLSERATLTYEEFTALYLPSKQLPMLFFPWVYGGMAESFYGVAYFGKWNCSELVGYVGLVPWMAALGFAIRRGKSGEVWFWLGSAALALLLVLGRKTPLAAILHQVPVYGSFRGPARHFLELTLALSVLCGYGIAALQRMPAARRRRALERYIVCFAVVFTAAGCKLLLDADWVSERAGASGVASFSLMPWSNRAVGVPVVIALLGAGSLYWWGVSQRVLPAVVLMCAVVVDLGSCGWFHSWRYEASEMGEVREAQRCADWHGLLKSERQRFAHWNVGSMATERAAANVSLLRGWLNVGGYSPLRLRRHAELLESNNDGGLTSAELRGPSQAANLLAVRWVVFPKRADEAARFDRDGVVWSEQDWELALGRNCVEPAVEEVSIRVSASAVGGIAMVSCLGHAACVPDGTPVAELRVERVGGRSETVTLQAGMHTAETAWERAARGGSVAHGTPEVFRSFESLDAVGKPCRDHHYVAVVRFDEPREVRRLSLRWVGPEGVVLKLFKMSLLGANGQCGEPVPESATLVGDPRRWQRVGDGVWENRNAMPRAWLAAQVVRLDADAILRVIREGQFADGSRFDPRSTALVEQATRSFAPASLGGARTGNGTVTVLRDRPTTVELSTHSDRERFLVVSDVYYPGWQASIDGKPVRVYRTNYLLRGVRLPAGRHTVRFVFRPKSFYFGCAVATLAAGVLAALAILSQRRCWESRRVARGGMTMAGIT